MFNKIKKNKFFINKEGVCLFRNQVNQMQINPAVIK